MSPSRRIVPGLAGRHVIFGRRLGILGADFLELLECAQVGLVEGHLPSPKELIDCVAILSRAPAEAALAMEKGTLWSCFGEGRFLGPIRKMSWTSKLARILRGGKEYQKGLRQLDAWLADNWRPPKIRWKAAGDKKAASPYTDHLRILLCEKGIVGNMKEAGRYPLSDAAWEAEAAHEAATGESRLESDADRQANELLNLSEQLAQEERGEQDG